MNDNSLNSISAPPKARKKSKIFLEKTCSTCSELIQIKWVAGKQRWSGKNYLFFWTEKEKDKEKYACNSCLRQWYYKNYDDFSKNIANSKKRFTFSQYLATKLI